MTDINSKKKAEELAEELKEVLINLGIDCIVCGDVNVEEGYYYVTTGEAGAILKEYKFVRPQKCYEENTLLYYWDEETRPRHPKVAWSRGEMSETTGHFLNLKKSPNTGFIISEPFYANYIEPVIPRGGTELKEEDVLYKFGQNPQQYWQKYCDKCKSEKESLHECGKCKARFKSPSMYIPKSDSAEMPW